MAAITAKDVAALRAQTGIGMMECKKALVEAEGDMEKALKVRASSVIIAHNHPDGIALPSREDEVFTRALYDALETVGIRLEDHIIAAEDDYTSMADTGLLYARRR